jgi:hypothetical protein
MMFVELRERSRNGVRVAIVPRLQPPDGVAALLVLRNWWQPLKP